MIKGSSFIASNLVLNGNIEIKGNIRIDGKVEGSITGNQTVTIGECAKINADIKAKNIISSGEIVGTIFAKDKVHLNNYGKLKGSIKTSTLYLDKNFLFEGDCEIIKDEN